MEAVQQLALASGIAIGGMLLGAAVSACLHRRRRSREARRIADLIAAGGVPPVDASHPWSPVFLSVSARMSALQAAHDEQESQRRQLSADMVRLMTQADGAVRARDRFLAAISHDLRQPLQAMDLALEQLDRDPLPGQARDMAQLHGGMRTLTDVLDGLLLLSQLEAGTLRPQAAACDLDELFAEVLSAQVDAARDAGVSLHAHAGRHSVYTDAGMLAGLLGRLLDNSIKASQAGSRVLVAARRHGGEVRIEIRDGGVGIAPIHQPRVFDEFFQVGNPERDHRKGLGLGLPIVSRLAALLGTRVELRSRLHAGSCFWLALPRASVVQRPPRAVIVDADALQRDALAAMLKSWGYAVHAEATTEAARVHLGRTADTLDALLCAIDDDEDPAWSLLGDAAGQHPQAARIVLCASPGPRLPDLASRHGALALSRPPAPSKLRSLLAQRPRQALRGAA